METRANQALVKTFPTGTFIDLLNFDHSLVDFDDVAHHLSLISRYMGATKYPYTVAQHSCLVAALSPNGYMLHGLLHDAAEYLLGDMVTNLKHSDAMQPFRYIENVVHTGICRQAGLEADEASKIMTKAAEKLAWPYEEYLVGRSSIWKAFVKGTLPYEYCNRIMNHEEAEEEFKAMFTWLQRNKL